MSARRAAGAVMQPSVYVSLAITSGGYKRDEQLDTTAVIAANTDYGAALRELFVSHGYAPSEVVIPSELGGMQRPQWGQLDFLMLWFHVMANVNHHTAWAIEKQLMVGGLDERLYGPGKWEQNEKLGGLSAGAAWVHYEAFTRRYVDALRSLNPRYFGYSQPIPRVVGALDTDVSLGCKAEKVWAELMQVPYYQLEVAAGHAPDRLQRHEAALTAMGAQAVRLSSAPGPSMLFARA